MSFINKISAMNSEIESLANSISELEAKKTIAENNLNNLIFYILKEETIENIVIYIKEICINKYLNKFSLNLLNSSQKVILSIYLDYVRNSQENFSRTLTFNGVEINMYFNANDSYWLQFEVNKQANLGFYLRLFDLDLSDINKQEIEEFKIESYKYIIDLIENNIFK